jgi:hypothetical protein
MYTYNLAIRTQRNLGYIEVVSGLRVALVYVYSLLFLGSSLDVVRLTAIAAAVAAVVVIAFTRSPSALGSPLSATPTVSWSVWALVSAVSFATLMVTIRAAADRGTSAYAATFWILLIAGLMFVAQRLALSGRERNSVAREGQARMTAGATAVVLIMTAAAACIGNAALFRSNADAPNLGYPSAISGGRVVILYFVAVFMGHSKLRWIQLGAVVLMVVSIGALGL